jgi:hypothetical protein
MKILIVVHHRLDLWNLPTWFGQRLEEEFPRLSLVQRNSYEGVEEHLRDSDIIFTLSLRPGTIRTLPKSALDSHSHRRCASIPVP